MQLGMVISAAVVVGPALTAAYLAPWYNCGIQLSTLRKFLLQLENTSRHWTLQCVSALEIFGHVIVVYKIDICLLTYLLRKLSQVKLNSNLMLMCVSLDYSHC